MRKYGSSKKNPNPPWPCEQRVVVVPPGSNSAAIGARSLPRKDVYMPVADYIHSRDEGNPIMDYTNLLQSSGESLNKNTPACSMGVSDYLCSQAGNYARVEFMFGENTHIEKTGVLESVGRDFIVLAEAGSGARVVCSVKNIKFINIYNVR